MAFLLRWKRSSWLAMVQEVGSGDLGSEDLVCSEDLAMVDSSEDPATTETVTAQRSIDGAAFASCTNSVTELSNGVYNIDLSAADLNGDNIMLRFSSTLSKDRLISIDTVL